MLGVAGIVVEEGFSELILDQSLFVSGNRLRRALRQLKALFPQLGARVISAPDEAGIGVGVLKIRLDGAPANIADELEGVEIFDGSATVAMARRPRFQCVHEGLGWYDPGEYMTVGELLAGAQGYSRVMAVSLGIQLRDNALGYCVVLRDGQFSKDYGALMALHLDPVYRNTTKVRAGISEAGHTWIRLDAAAGVITRVIDLSNLDFVLSKPEPYKQGFGIVVYVKGEQPPGRFDYQRIWENQVIKLAEAFELFPVGPFSYHPDEDLELVYTPRVPSLRH